MKEIVVPSSVSGQLEIDRSCACTVAAHGYVSWISAKEADVLLDPLQGFPLVSKAVVGCTTSEDLRTGQESVGTYSVVEGDNDNVQLAGCDQAAPVVVGVGIYVEPAALNKEEDWQLRVWRRRGRGVNIQKQAILAHGSRGWASGSSQTD